MGAKCCPGNHETLKTPTLGARAEPSEDRVEAVLEGLRNQGGRVTPARRIIVEELLAKKGTHLNAEQVVAGVRQRLPNVAESTVYRTLSALEDLNVVNHVHLGHGPATYHLSGASHRHLVCTTCETVTDLSAETFDVLAETLRQRYGFSLTDEHFALSGHCERCARAKAATE